MYRSVILRQDLAAVFQNFAFPIGADLVVVVDHSFGGNVAGQVVAPKHLLGTFTFTGHGKCLVEVLATSHFGGGVVLFFELNQFSFLVLQIIDVVVDGTSYIVEVELSAHYIFEEEEFAIGRMFADVVTAVLQKAVGLDLAGLEVGEVGSAVLAEEAVLGIHLVGAVVDVAVQGVSLERDDDAFAQIDLSHAQRAEGEEDKGKKYVPHNRIVRCVRLVICVYRFVPKTLDCMVFVSKRRQR